jgi:uncharacterized protein (DUF427 family)
MSNPEKTFAASLGHKNVRPIDRRVRIRYGSFTLVDTDEAMMFHEHGRDPVVFVPRRHLPVEFLPDDGHLGTPQAGRAARYWDFSVGGQTAENGVWSFERPQGELAELAGFVAFDPAQVEFDSEEESADTAEVVPFDAAETARRINLLRD